MKNKPIRCTDCGKFMKPTNDDICEFEPLSEFGPEKIEWTHRACLEQREDL